MTTASNAEGFERAEQERRRLTRLITDVGAVADSLHAAGAPEIRKLGERVQSEAFKIMVVGEFKRGKSTLVNSLLGAKFLPAYARPATAVLTELRWAREPVAVLHPADGGAPVRIDVNNLEAEITIPRRVKQGSGETSRWKLAEIGWPLELLRNSVVVIDSPGLNEHEARQKVTMGSLKQADAVVFVVDAQHSPSIEEANFLRNSLASYDVFFVINKINIVDEDERQDVVEEIIFRLQDKRRQERRDRYHPVDARRALDARISADQGEWSASGVAGFIDDLTTYLVTDRQRAKLSGPAHDMVAEIGKLGEDIKTQRRLTHQSLDDLKRRQRDAEAPLRRLEERAEQIRRELNQDRRHLEQAVRADSLNRLLLIAAEMPDVIEPLTPDAKLSLRPWRSKEAAQDYAEELAQLAAAEITARFQTGQRQHFDTRIAPGLREMTERAELMIRSFMRDFSQVRRDLTGVDLADVTEVGAPAGVDAPSLSDMDLTETIEMKHFGAQVAGSYAIMLAWCFTPWGLPTLIVGVLLGNIAIFTQGRRIIARSVRGKVSAKLAEKVRADTPAMADECAEQFGTELTGAIDQVVARMDTEVRQLRAQVDEALKTLAEGEDAVRLRQEQLDQWESDLIKNNAAIEDLIADLELG